MIRRRLATALLALPLALAACAETPVDDPANPARLGQWRIEQRFESLTAGNRTLNAAAMANEQGGEDIINGIRQDRTLACAEPDPRSEDRVVEQFSAGLGNCSARPSRAGGPMWLQCRQNGFDARADLDPSFTADSGHVRVEIRVADKDGDGPDQATTVRAVQRWQRIGDCG